MATTQLTQREAEVLDLAVRGLSNDEIAARLEISPRTVEAHMRTLFRKTGVTRRAQLGVLVDWDGRAGVELSRREPDGPDEARIIARGTPPATLAEHDRRLQLYAAAIRRLIDRQMPLFEERVEITVTIGARDGQDSIVERRWTTPRRYLVYRMLRPIVAWTDGPAPDPEVRSLT